VERSRSFQFFATNPPKPPQLAVSDHMNSVSGNDRIARTTSREARLFATSEASGGTSRNRKM
jgi:hypothetical protein